VGPEHRSEPPAHATGAVQLVDLDDIASDDLFRLRAEGDVSALAASIGRLGQLHPVELRPLAAAAGGPRWQLVAGFRRVAALRMLLREKVLARLHQRLADEDAWAVALTQALGGEPLGEAEVEALRARLQATGVAPWALDLLDGAATAEPASTGGDVEELSPEDFARDLAKRMAGVCQDLATAHDAWSDLPRPERQALLEQARWVAELLPWLEEAEG
jgi:hypothetical protein